MSRRPADRPWCWLASSLTVALLLLVGVEVTFADEGHATATTEPSAAPPTLQARSLPGPRADVAALLWAAEEGGSLWAAALAVARPLESNAENPVVARAELWLELDGARLLEEAGVDNQPATDGEDAPPDTLRLELHAYALTRQGELAGSLSRRVRVPLATHGEALRQGGLQLVAPFDLPPGEYQLRALVRETRSQRFALRLVQITLPKGSAPWIAPPLRQAPQERWIAVRDTVSERPPAKAPAALPVLTSGPPIAFDLVGRVAPDTPLTARLLDLEGKVLAQPTVEPSAWPGATTQIAVTLDLGAVEPGAYRLAVAAGSAESAPIQVAMLPAGIESAGVAWTGLDQLAAAAPGTHPTAPNDEPISPELAAERRTSRRVQAVARAYRQVLERMIHGDFEDAVTQLDTLESETLASDMSRSDALEMLINAEERVARQLARKDPEALLPLLLLHLKVYDLYGSGKLEPLRLIATRRRIYGLAEAYGQQSRQALARQLAATVLAEAGIAVDRHNMPQEARRMLEAAYQLDDGNPTQLLYLGYWYERRGYYEDAVRPLRRLISVDPSAHEGRLRLALCLRRLGQLDEAETLLRELLQRSAPDWQRILGYQELARVLLLKNRFGDALTLLDDAVQRFPDQQRLHFQRLYASERSGNGARVAALLRQVPDDNGRLSPRNLYSRRPRATHTGVRATLRRHAVARLPVLFGALAASGESR